MKEVLDSNLIRKKLADADKSAFRAYLGLTVGNSSIGRFFLYETLTCVLGPMPGSPGFFFRKVCYPRLFRRAGKGLIIGRNVVIRHPQNIALGDNVTIDENCVIDARGAGETGLVLDHNVIINRNCMLLAKAGPIRIGKRTSLGSNSMIVSMENVEVGEAVLTGGACNISGGSYHYEAWETPVMDQGAYSKGPIRIGNNAWFGTAVVVLDGVTIGDGAVIGACSLVNKAIPKNAIAFGVPAKVSKIKDQAHKDDDVLATSAGTFS
jgi:acetyltransferase-like isoleucine patch superfamily enzyme